MIKAGIIGFGGMGKYHQEQLEKVNEIEIKGIYDINPKRIDFAKENKIFAYSSREELLNDEEIELVIIATPNNFHKEISIDALEHGKNVVCEKPVMMDSEELLEVIDVMKKTGKIFTVHQNRRWDKDYNIVKKAIADNMIGKPFYIESRVQGANGIPGDWRCEKVAGGGMLYDWGIHLIDQIMMMNDSPVTEVYTHMLKVKYEVDDNFKALLKFKNGLSALIEVDTYTFINLPRWHVSGDHGTLVVENWECEGKVVKANLLEMNWEQGIVYTSAGPTRTMAPRPKESLETLDLPKVEPDCLDYYRNVYNAIKGKEELIVKPEQALRVMKVIDMIFDSAKYGLAIKTEI